MSPLCQFVTGYVVGVIAYLTAIRFLRPRHKDHPS